LAGQFDEYNDSQSTHAADAKAIFCDWRIVGDTIRDALNVFRRDQEAQPSARG